MAEIIYVIAKEDREIMETPYYVLAKKIATENGAYIKRKFMRDSEMNRTEKLKKIMKNRTQKIVLPR